tara:strand:+ start:6178 stop:7515 length:1338 start_codon:yes stop_codon:yes gene_type:complete
MLNKIIINKNVVLKKLRLKNINNNYLSWLKDPSLKKKLVNIHFDNIKELKDYYKKMIKKKNLIFFGIFFNGKHIGNLKFENIYLNSKTAIWGILIGDKKYRGKGIGSEVLSKSMSFIENRYSIKNFIVSVTHLNKNAIKLYSDLGFRRFKYSKGKIFLIRRTLPSKIILGSANFNNMYGYRKKSLKNKYIKYVLNFAKKNGINFIDTASSYGKSEKVLGENQIKDFEIISKFPKIRENENTKKFIVEHLNKTLSNLKKKSIYAYLIHNTDDLFSRKKNTILKTLNSLKKQNRIKKIGVSVYEVEELKKILKFFKPDVVQLPVNILNQNFLKKNFLKTIKKKGIEIHARSIFLQGMLLKYKKTKLGNAIKEKMKNIDTICKKKKIRKLCVLLNLANSIKEIDKLVVGIDSADELKQIIRCNDNSYLIDNYKALSIHDKEIIDPRTW